MIPVDPLRPPSGARGREEPKLYAIFTPIGSLFTVRWIGCRGSGPKR
jgi:hypothetical protein